MEESTESLSIFSQDVEEFVDVEELIGWLDEIWQSGDFNEAVEASGDQ